jgi:hypothetical protein
MAIRQLLPSDGAADGVAEKEDPQLDFLALGQLPGEP